MRAQSASFFATRSDLEPGLRVAEQERPLKYALSGFYPSQEVAERASALEIPDLGTATEESHMGMHRYLVVDAATRIQARPVRQRRGGVLYLVDHVANPGGIFFRPGGRLGDSCRISGEIQGVGDARSLDLYRAFAGAVLAGFERITTFWVGREAARLLDNGARLTQGVGVPATYDLKREEPAQVVSVPPAATARRSLQESWADLMSRGFEVRWNDHNAPLLPERMPSHDKETLVGLRFFRTGLEDESLDGLTMPQTYFGRSEFRRVSFRNSDLSESRMCWNDWLECDFSEADLTGADMRGSVYERCRFAQALLAGADLRWSQFEGCDFTGAGMRGARLAYRQGADLPLTERQRNEVDWQTEDGPEPPGG
jgi:pentapeptide repeat protein